MPSSPWNPAGSRREAAGSKIGDSTGIAALDPPAVAERSLPWRLISMRPAVALGCRASFFKRS
jgi:hypothetical protein